SARCWTSSSRTNAPPPPASVFRVARTVVVSTHLDDAVLSCWSVLDAPGDVVVVTVFTGGPPPGTLTEWDRDSGAADSAERMIQRVEEDRAALRVAGREPVHVGLLEGQ